MKKFQVTILIVVCFVILALGMFVAKVPLLDTVVNLFKGALGSPSAISGTLKETTPLLLLGVSVFIALKAGLFNIGAEGQFLVGACAGSWTMLKLGGPIGVIAGSLVGAGAGMAWAWPAGWIKAIRGGHEVITTIMLNNIALNFTKYLVAGPMKGADQNSPSTSILPKNTQLTLLKLGGVELPQALFLSIVLLFAVGYWLYKTTSGYELRATGANATAAKFAGVKTESVTIRAMLISGAISGLAGALQVAQFDYRFYEGISPGYGFDALGVALLSGSSSLGLLASAAFFGILNKGGASLGIFGIDKGFTTMVLAIVIVIFAAVRFSKRRGAE